MGSYKKRALGITTLLVVSIFFGVGGAEGSSNGVILYDDFEDGTLGTNLGGEAGTMSPVEDLLGQLQMVNFIFDIPPNSGTIYIDYVRFSKPGSSLVMDDFNDGSPKNSLGGDTGKMDPNPSSYNEAITKLQLIGSEAYEGKGVVRFDYYRGTSSWVGYWSFMKPDQGAYDVSSYKELRMWVRGGSGGEAFKIELKDVNGNTRKTPITQVPGFKNGLTEEWQELVIPLTMFGGIRDPKVSFTSDAKEGSHSLHLDYNPITWCGYYTFLKADRSGYDASSYEELRMWVQGDSGGEEFWIKMEDTKGNMQEISIKSLTNFRDGLDTEWEELVMPLDRFGEVKMKELKMINLIFKESGSIKIDSMELIGDTTPPSSKVKQFESYRQRKVPFKVKVSAQDELSDIRKVSLFYRSSHDKVNWTDWKLYGTDEKRPFSFQFNAPDGCAIYEFYSIAEDESNNREDRPEKADAKAVVTIPAKVDVRPETLNRKSRGKWITGYIELPKPSYTRNIDLQTIKIETEKGSVKVNSKQKYGFVKNANFKDRNNNSIPELMVKFNRRELKDIVSAGKQKVKITGMVEEVPFIGEFNLRVK